MKVLVGSVNPSKIEATKQAFSQFFENVEVEGNDASSGVHPQPKSLQEMKFGAMNRAMNAFREGADFSVGIEAGIFEVEGTLSGYLDAAFVAIWNGQKFIGYGMSPSYEYPKSFIERLKKEDVEIADLFNEMLSRDDVHHKEGAIGVLTKGVIPRVELMKSGIVTALIPYVNKELYP